MYARAKTLLEAYPGPRVNHPLRRKPSPRDFALLARLVYRLGVVGRERRRFWDLMFWTARRRPKMLPNAFLFATLALQFRRMYERYRLSNPEGKGEGESYPLISGKAAAASSAG